MSNHKLIRVSSRESGPFNTAGQVIHIDVPQVGLCDLSNSYLLINARIDMPDNSMRNVVLESPTAVKTNYQNSCLVSHANWDTREHGPIELKREPHLIDSIQKVHNKSYQTTLSERYKKAVSCLKNNMAYANPTNNHASIFRQLTCWGNKPSQNLEGPIRINLHEIYGLGKLMQYPTDKLSTGITFQFHPERLHPIIKHTGIAGTAVGMGDWTSTVVDQDISITSCE